MCASTAFIVMELYKRRPTWRTNLNCIFVVAVSVGYFIAGAGASAGGWPRASSVSLLYIGITGFAGLGTGVYDYIIRMEGLLWFSVDGTVRRGIGIIGIGTGSAAIFFTLYTGWVRKKKKKRWREEGGVICSFF